jgi:Rho termination factor, N-terminal domain
VPTDPDPQRHLLRTIRQSQATAIDTLRAWTTITEQLTRTLSVPLPQVDLAGLVDGAFDAADQTLAAHHQLARTLAGLATRQADTTAEAVQTTLGERLRRVEDLADPAEADHHQQNPEQPPAPTEDPPKAASPRQDRRPDGRTYEERTLEELQERAAELQLQGRSTMTKDELITALRQHAK